MTSPNSRRLTQPYEYRPLRNGVNNIRLLQILPGTGSADICCQVFQYTLRIEKAFGLYEALSYVWGDAASPEQIWVKNAEDEHYRMFSVTQNLYGALHRLRDADLPRTVWIDAVCINQADLEERAAQVQIMARIYAYAVSVTVWLGDEANDSSKALELLRRIVAGDLKYSYDWETAVATLLAPAADSIVALLGRSWFRRAWVVQEAAVARVVSVTCGAAETTGAIFASGMELAFELLRDKFEEHDYESIPPVVMLMNQSNGAFPLLQKLADLNTSSVIPSFNVLPLGDLVRLFQNHEATDKRDKIYALLGLSSDNDHSPNLRPDYTKSWATLFREIIIHVLGSSPVVATWENEEHAVILEKGSVLGTMYPGLTDNLAVVSPVFGHAPSIGYVWRASWTVPHDADSIQEGDILVFFQNARRPSVIRPCGDHFDVVMISLPPPPVVIISQSPRTERLENVQVRWDDFAPGARRLSRQFHLVWDWKSGIHDCKLHDALLHSCEGSCTTTSTERRFHTARVLDDIVDTVNLTRLLKEGPSMTDFGPMEKYLVLLGHVLVHWDDYLRMKQYFSTLNWCIWALRAPINAHYLLDYWHHVGPVTTDLFDIVQLAEANVDRVAQLKPGYRYTCMRAEPWQDVLYPIIFGECSPVMVYITDLEVKSGTMSPYNGLYLMRLVLASQTSFEAPSKSILRRIYLDPILVDKSHYVFLMFLEHHATTIDTGFCVELGTQISDRDPHFSFFAFWFTELAHNPVTTYFFLSSLLQLDLGPDFLYRLWREVLEPHMGTILFHFRSPLICQIEMHLWTRQHGMHHSVLWYLYEWLRSDFPALDNLSLYNTAQLYSVEMLIRWAHRTMIIVLSDLVEEKKWRRRRKKARRPRRPLPSGHEKTIQSDLGSESGYTSSSSAFDV